jgi:hypothetical protein
MDDTTRLLDNQDEAWDSIFDVKYETVITAGSELLCKDFCIFTTDNKYVMSRRGGCWGLSLCQTTSNIIIIDDLGFCCSE